MEAIEQLKKTTGDKFEHNHPEKRQFLPAIISRQ
jgi:hypothetical protein